MDEFLVDFVIVAVIFGALVIATMVLLFLHSKNVRRFFGGCWCCRGMVGDVEKSALPPKRTTIRVVKSSSENVITTIPISPPANSNLKPPVRRVTSNPPDMHRTAPPTSAKIPLESPSQKFVFIFPKRPTYQMESNQATLHSASTKSSYLPQIGSQSSRRSSN